MSSSSPTTPEVTVFGLTFEQQDTRLMQEVLKSFERLPSQPDDRVALWSALLSLVRDADANEIEILRSWYAQSDEEEDANNNADDDGEASEDSTHGDADEADDQIDEDTNMGVTNEADSELDEEGKEYYSRNYIEISSDSSDSTDSDMDLDEGTPGDADEAEGQIDGDANMSVTNNEADSELDEEGKEYYSRNYSDNSSASSDSTDSDMDLDDGTPGPISPKPKGGACVICGDKRHETEFPPSKITSSCKHHATVCLKCLGGYITVSVEGGAIGLHCPVCAEKLSRSDIKTYAPEKVFERYEYLVSRKSMPVTYVMCLSPNCNSGQLPVEGEAMMVCNTCQFKTCALHKLPWHEGMTCAEFDALESQVDRLMEEEATAKLLAKTSKICPSCKQCITKESGCDHLECVCGAEWCYFCLAPWSGGVVHEPTCIYHPESIAAMQPNPVREDTKRLMELVHGGPISEELQRAGDERKARFQVESDDDDYDSDE